MKIIKKWFMKGYLCSAIFIYYEKKGFIDLLAFKWVNRLILKIVIKKGKLDRANWLIVRLLEKTDAMRYAIFAMEKVINKWERRKPDNLKPRKVIEAAKEYITKPSEENTNKAIDAATSAFASFIACYDHDYATDDTIKYTARLITDVVCNATDGADWIMLKIIRYGISLLKKEGNASKII